MLSEPGTEMFTHGEGVPKASIKPPIATEATKELIIKARDAIAAIFKAAGYSLENVHQNLCTSHNTHFDSTIL